MGHPCHLISFSPFKILPLPLPPSLPPPPPLCHLFEMTRPQKVLRQVLHAFNIALTLLMFLFPSFSLPPSLLPSLLTSLLLPSLLLSLQARCLVAWWWGLPLRTCRRKMTPSPPQMTPRSFKLDRCSLPKLVSSLFCFSFGRSFFLRCQTLPQF